MTVFAPGSVATEQSALTVTTGRWFGASSRQLLGWLTTPAKGLSTAGVLILPHVGAQYWSAHRTLRVIAERLAAKGQTVLRIDYDGTGDSAGDQWDAARVASWRASAASGAAELRALGCDELTVVGVRLGALLALVDGGSLQADQVIAWSPPHTGKRLVRALRLLGEAVPDGSGVATAGMVFTAETLADLAQLDPAQVPTRPAPRTLVLGDLPAATRDHLVSLGSQVDVQEPTGAEIALDKSAEDADVATSVVDAVDRWVRASPRPLGSKRLLTAQWPRFCGRRVGSPSGSCA